MVMAKKTKEKSVEDIKKFLENKIKISGFSLENKVERILQKSYSTKREIPFHDRDENKGRRFDISARKRFPDETKLKKNVLHFLAGYELLLECKDISGNIWVFSKSQNKGVGIPDHASMNQDQRPDPIFNIMPYYPIEELPYVSGFHEYIFDKKRSNKQENNLSSALFSITKACRHEKDEYKKTFEIFPRIGWPTKQSYILHSMFFQPIIVFTGKIFVTSFNDKNEQIIEEVRCVQIEKGYVSKEYHETSGEIHIVSLDYFEEYLEKIDNYYRQNESIIIKHQSSFFKSLQKVMPVVPLSLKLP